MAMALVGALPSATARGRMEVSGLPVRFRSPHDALEAGVAYVTEDRKGRGIFPTLNTQKNITLTRLGEFTKSGFLRLSFETEVAQATLSEFGIRSDAINRPIASLSGGNQQKALLARFLSRPTKLVILDEPTRGVDVGARVDIYRLMNRLTDGGVGILMISSDLPELLGMSDRIVVMRTGTTTGELTRENATPDKVMSLAMAN